MFYKDEVLFPIPKFDLSFSYFYFGVETLQKGHWS